MPRHLIFLLFTFLLLPSCSDEDDPLPAYVEGLADLQTNSSGRATAMVTDEGEKLVLNNEVGGLCADTTYRILAAYVPKNGSATLNSYARILATEVQKYNPKQVKADPLSVTSCWRGADYINLRLAVKGTAQAVHYFGFHQTGFLRNQDGSATLCALLTHDQNSDPLQYTRETYLSLPLRPLSALLTAGRDSVRLTVKTFDGDFSRTFAY